MSILLTLVHSVITYLLVGFFWIIFGLPACIILLFPEHIRYNSKLYFWLSYQFSYWSLKATLVPIKFVGLNNIPRSKPVVFAANHQSSMDIIILGTLAKGHPSVWLAWSQLVRYPVLGFILQRIAVLVDTTTPQRATRTLLQAIKRIKDNCHHVIIFPEGARYTDGKVHDFFSGFAILAQRTNRPVVPVFIKDAYKVYPPTSWLVHWHRVKVIVGAPFEFHEDEDVEAFKKRIYSWFVEQQEK